jgi:tRNA threonylcarbamoyladenosine biosynthesis protein TsaB
MLLAIDTSSSQIGLACIDPSGLLAECSWSSGRDHTAQLLPQLDLLIRHLGRTRTDIRALGVALGPGSWSGMRVGLSTVKGLALALDLPVIGVGTLEALAYQFGGAGLPTVPIVRLGRDRLAAPGSDGIPQNTTVELLAADVVGKALFCGDIDSDIRAALTERLGKRARFPEPAASLRRPGYLAELAWKRFQAGDVDDIAILEPIYLGQPVRLAQP